jgi:hypothetical protein
MNLDPESMLSSLFTIFENLDAWHATKAAV